MEAGMNSIGAIARRGFVRPFAVFCVAALMVLPLQIEFLHAQAPNPAVPSTLLRSRHVPAKAQKQPGTEAPTQAPAQAAAPIQPPEPPKPDWPANDKPEPAKVLWDSHGLTIDANNSSLDGILKEVAAETGAKLDGKVGDDRVFGNYGPGPARDIIEQLLDGTPYNVLMAGDQGEGTPREIVLSSKPTGPAPVNNNAQNDTYEEQNDYDQPQPMQPIQPIRTPFGQPGQSPEEMQQINEERRNEMMQREEQMREQQQQQQQQQNQQ